MPASAAALTPTMRAADPSQGPPSRALDEIKQLARLQNDEALAPVGTWRATDQPPYTRPETAPKQASALADR
jgi:hypothetical protein